MRFESLVNTEGFQTQSSFQSIRMGLRVLLIQKDFKLNGCNAPQHGRLRVLLIQKDFKQRGKRVREDERLRVLLIQKDFKHSSCSRI